MIFTSRNKLVVVQVLNDQGSGFGKLILVKDPLTHQRYMLSEYKIGGDSNWEFEIAQLLQSFRHPNVIASFAAIEENGLYSVLLESTEGTLENAITRNFVSSELQLSSWCRQVVSALSFLHQENVTHKAVRTNNIFLFNRQEIVKLGEFGVFKQQGKGNLLPYLSPELLAQETKEMFNHPSNDIWSLGICLYRMASSEFPFVAGNFNEMATSVRVYRPLPPFHLASNLSDDFWEFLLALLSVEQLERPSAFQLYSFQFLLKPDKLGKSNDSQDNLSASLIEKLKLENSELKNQLSSSVNELLKKSNESTELSNVGKGLESKLKKCQEKHHESEVFRRDISEKLRQALDASGDEEVFQLVTPRSKRSIIRRYSDDYRPPSRLTTWRFNHASLSTDIENESNIRSTIHFSKQFKNVIFRSPAGISAVLPIKDKKRPLEPPSVIIVSELGHIFSLSRSDWTLVEWQAKVKLDNIDIGHAVYDNIEDNLYFTNMGSDGGCIYQVSRTELIASAIGIQKNSRPISVPLRILVDSSQTDGRRFRGLAIEPNSRLLFACDRFGSKNDVSIWLLPHLAGFSENSEENEMTIFIGSIDLGIKPVNCAFTGLNKSVAPLAFEQIVKVHKKSAANEDSEKVVLLAIEDSDSSSVGIYAKSERSFSSKIRHALHPENVEYPDPEHVKAARFLLNSFHHITTIDSNSQSVLNRSKSSRPAATQPRENSTLNRVLNNYQYRPFDFCFDQLGNFYITDRSINRLLIYSFNEKATLENTFRLSWHSDPIGMWLTRVVVAENPKSRKLSVLASRMHDLLIFE